MEVSPALRAPRRGEPITAEWAANVADALNSTAEHPRSSGAIQSPFGIAEPPAAQELAQGAPNMPFDCRLVWNDSTQTNHLFCFLPRVGATSGANYLVTLYGEDTRARNGQALGTTSNGWADLGEIAGSSRNWLTLQFTAPTNTDGTHLNTISWGLWLNSGNAPTDASWAWTSNGRSMSPRIPIAFVYEATDNHAGNRGLIQYHRGTVALGTMAWIPFGLAGTNMTNQIGDASGNLALDLTNGTDVGVYKNLDVQAGLSITGSPVATQTITDKNDVTVTVLCV